MKRRVSDLPSITYHCDTCPLPGEWVIPRGKAALRKRR